jgi:serine/threonine protein kinase
VPYVLIVIMDYYQYNFEEFVEKMPRPLAESIAVQILIQIFEGLKYLIRNNIVHRDLKPDNILLSYETIEGNVIKGLRVVLTDFGTHLTKLTLETTSAEDRALLKIPKGAEYLRAPEAWPPKSKSTAVSIITRFK